MFWITSQLTKWRVLLACYAKYLTPMTATGSIADFAGGTGVAMAREAAI
jgi:hypothetical protein